MDFQKIYAEFKEADAKHNIEKMSDIIVQVNDCCNSLTQAGRANEIPSEAYKVVSYVEILLYQIMQLLNDGKSEKATFYLLAINKICSKGFINFFYLQYLFARALYLNGDYRTAEKIFYRYEETRAEQWDDFDELSMFYQANCCALLGEFDTAIKFYEFILKMKANFPEAKKNLNVVRRGSNKNLVREVKSLWKFTSWRDVPIFINARDRLGVMKKLIDWLLAAGYRNLIILDNNSTYPPLLKYYNEIECMRGGISKLLGLGKISAIKLCGCRVFLSS